MTYTTGLSLIEIITENEESPKAIIMAGGAGAGKSYLLEKLNLDDLTQFNPDKYVEDPDHPYYNNLGAASRQVEKDVMAAAKAENKIRFIWDTTASGKNFDKHLDELLSLGYDIYMVMVYTHPMISYVSNFKRKRNIPSSSVFLTLEKCL
jgi:predicted ABC-type ATPase